MLKTCSVCPVYGKVRFDIGFKTWRLLSIKDVCYNRCFGRGSIPVSIAYIGSSHLIGTESSAWKNQYC